MTAQWHFNQPKPGDKNREFSEIVQILAEGEDKTDPYLLLDFFSLPQRKVRLITVDREL